MDILFLKSCATVDTIFKKGGVYGLPKEEAEGFINAGVAKKVGNFIEKPAKVENKQPENSAQQNNQTNSQSKPSRGRRPAKKK